MELDWKAVLALGLVGAIAVYFLKKQATAAMSAVGQAINPVSSSNIAYQGASALTSAVTGSNESLGAQIYDWFNPAPPLNPPSGQ